MAQATKKWYNEAIVRLLYVLAAGIPLVFSTAFYSNFAAPKLLLLRTVTLLIVLLWAWKSYAEEKLTWRRGMFSWVLLLYGAVLVLATVTSSNIFTSLFGTETRFLGVFTQLNFLFAAWLAYNFLVTEKQLRTFIAVMCVTGIGVLMLYGWMQYFGLFQDGFSWSQNPQDRVFGTLGHSNHFGAYMGMCVLLSFGVVPFIRNKLLKRLLVLCAHAAFLVILLTGSRGAFVATVLALLTVGGILVWLNPAAKSFLKKRAKIIVLFIAAVVGVLFVFRQQIAEIPLVQRIQQGTEAVENGYTPDRVSWWYSSLEMFKDRPFLGFGLGTFRDIYNGYRRYDYRVAGPGNIQYQISPESSHNDYIDILVTQGLIGFAAFVVMIVFVFTVMDRKLFKQKPDELFYVTLGVKGALMVYLIQVFVNFGVVDTLSVFFLLLGAGVSASGPARSEKFAEMKLKPYVKEFAVFTLLILVIWGGVSTFREAKAEYYYKNAVIEQSLGRPENARVWYEEAVNNQPYRYEYYQAFADMAFKTATAPTVDPTFSKQYLELALANYQKATLLNNFHPSTYYNMGVTSIQLARMEQNDAYLQQGINQLQQAINLSPNNPLYAYESAKIFAELGYKDMAVQNFSNVVRLDPKYMDAQQRLTQLQENPSVTK
jgi:O-antigen ligase